MTQVPPLDIFTRRVCLQLDGMAAVSVRRDIPYGSGDDDRRVMDAYYPPGAGGEFPWPAVVIVAGYPGTLAPRPTTLTYKEMGWTVSTAQLIAVSGMVAVAYANREPVVDLETLLDHLHEHATSLRIDVARVGVIAVSGNVPTALTTVMRSSTHAPRCAVFGYGCLLDLDGATDVAEASKQFGFANPCSGRSVGDIRPDVPLLISRAGRDQFPAMNGSIDRFVPRALAENLPITVVNHAEGAHAFDLFEDSGASRAVVRHTLRFLQQHLTPEDGPTAPALAPFE